MFLMIIVIVVVIITSNLRSILLNLSVSIVSSDLLYGLSLSVSHAMVDWP